MTTALLMIDMQMGMTIYTETGADRANPQADARAGDLLALFRRRGLPVIHIHHNEAEGPIAIGQPGGAPIPVTAPAAGEPVIVKTTSSAFAGTGLEAHLRQTGVARLVVAGAEAGYCVTSTVRAACDLGFKVLLAQDALIGFDQPRADGSRISAETVMDVTLALLGSGFATVLTAREVEAAL